MPGRQARDLGGNLGQDVDRVAGNQDDPRGVGGDHFRYDIPDHAGIGSQQIEPRLAGTLVGSRGDHDQVATRQQFITPGTNAHRADERQAMVQIHRLALGPRLVRVNQYQFVGQAGLHEGIGK